MSVFISYRREDSAGHAGRLHEELEQRLGKGEVFRDVDTLSPGADFLDTINVQLRQCSVLVAVIGRGWLTARTAAGTPRLEQATDYVLIEIAAALERPDVLVVPVLVEGAAMPTPAQLPDKIKGLARRHALTLSDETWETDVDRLAAVLTRSAGRRRVPLRRGAMLLGSLAAASAVAFFLLRDAGGTDAPGSAGVAPSNTSTPVVSVAYAIDIPRLAEVAHGSLIYTLISGSVSPRGSTNGVRLRFRVSNEGRYDANLWDASFRLAMGDNVVTPTSGLNELVAGRSIEQAIVTFTVPSGSSRAVLRILNGNDVAEIPLDLSPTGRAVEDEKADAGDALSRARLASLLRDAVPLTSADGLSTTLVRVTSRLFANTLRINAAVRFTHEGPYPVQTGVLILRVVAGDELIAPVSAPNEVVQPHSSFSGDFAFEIPSSSKKIELRASAGNQSSTVPLEVR